MGVSDRYQDGWWQSVDGLNLHYRDYPGGPEAAGRPPILCIPGLTRNARDFEVVAERLSPQWRVICVDLRGRGESTVAPDSSTYTPPSYVLDIGALFVALALDKTVLLGTSLGGLIAMLMALTTPERLAGVLLNDIGPVVEPAGMARIRSYVGKSASWPTWLHAARGLAEMQGDIFPRYQLERLAGAGQAAVPGHLGRPDRVRLRHADRRADPRGAGGCAARRSLAGVRGAAWSPGDAAARRSQRSVWRTPPPWRWRGACRSWNSPPSPTSAMPRRWTNRSPSRRSIGCCSVSLRDAEHALRLRFGLQSA